MSEPVEIKGGSSQRPRGLRRPWNTDLFFTSGEKAAGSLVALVGVMGSVCPGATCALLEKIFPISATDTNPPDPAPLVDRVDLEAQGYLPSGQQELMDDDDDWEGLAWERPTGVPPPDDGIPEQLRKSKAEEIEERIAKSRDQQLASIGDWQKGADAKGGQKGGNDKSSENNKELGTKGGSEEDSPPPPENPKKSSETTTVKPPVSAQEKDPEVFQARRWTPPNYSGQSTSYGPPPTHRISSYNTPSEIGAHKPPMPRTLVQSGVSALINAGQKLEVIAQRFGTTVCDLLTINPTLVVDGSGRVDSNAEVAIPGYRSPSQKVPVTSEADNSSVLEVVVLAQDNQEPAGMIRPSGSNPGKHALQHNHGVERATLAEEIRVVMPDGEEVANYVPGDQVVIRGFRVSDKGEKLILVQVGDGENSHVVAVSEGAFDLGKGEVIENPRLPLIIRGDNGERATDAVVNGGGSEQVVRQVSPTPTDRAASVASDGRNGIAQLVGGVMVGASVTIPESLIGEGVTAEVLASDGSSHTIMINKGETLILRGQTKGLNGETLVLASLPTGEIVRIDISNFDPKLRASMGGAGEEAMLISKNDELVGVIDPGLVDFNRNSRVDIDFVPVNFAGNEWSDEEKVSIGRVVAISGTVLREIVGGNIQASVPDAFVGSRHSVQVNVIKPEAWWNQNWWGFDNSGRFGLAIIAPDNMINETVSFENLAESGLPHEIVHAVNPLPKVEGDSGFDFALREGVPELVNRVVSSRHTGFDITQQGFEGRDFGDWMSLSDTERLSLTEEERYDFVGFAFIWLFHNHPATLHSIRDGWLNEFPDSTGVPLESFIEWGQEGWSQTSSLEDSQFPGGFRDFWQRMNFGNQ